MDPKAGVFHPLTDDEAANHSLVDAVYKGENAKITNRYLQDLSTLGGTNVTIPAGSALVIIGGRKSIYQALSRLGLDWSITTASGFNLHVAARRPSGGKRGATIRRLGFATKAAGAVMATPIGVTPAIMSLKTDKSFGEAYAGGMKAAARVVTSPMKTGRMISQNTKTYQVIQITDVAGRTDQVFTIASHTVDRVRLVIELVVNGLIKDRD
jgi:hypothetical protein